MLCIHLCNPVLRNVLIFFSLKRANWILCISVMTAGTYRTCINHLSQAPPFCTEISSGAACSSPPCNNSSCTIVLYSFAEINFYLFVLACKFPCQKAINIGNTKYSQNVVLSFTVFLLQSLSKTKTNKQTKNHPQNLLSSYFAIKL